MPGPRPGKPHQSRTIIRTHRAPGCVRLPGGPRGLNVPIYSLREEEEDGGGEGRN